LEDSKRIGIRGSSGHFVTLNPQIFFTTFT